MIKNIIDNNYKINICDGMVHLTNYKDIIDISSNKIIILLNDNRIIINGCNLYVCGLDKYEILIKGIIKGLEFNNEK